MDKSIPKQDNLSQEEQVQLRESQQVVSLMGQEGFKLLKAYLEDQIHHSWLDPRTVSDKDTFMYQYVTAWGSATSAEGLLRWFEEHEYRMKSLLEKAEGKNKDK